MLIVNIFLDILTNREYHEDFGLRLQSLNSNETKTLYANAVFVDVHSKLRDMYRAYLERVYKGEARHADFGDSEAVKLMINELVLLAFFLLAQRSERVISISINTLAKCRLNLIVTYFIT